MENNHHNKSLHIYQNDQNTGKKMYELLVKLFPICRSITGYGVRNTLEIIKEHIPIKIYEIPSGTRVFDWVIPNEWNIKEAYIEDINGNRIVDFHKNNLHIVGYSVPVDLWLPLRELQKHLHSLEEQPDAIPYITSYYNEYWGFCLTHNERQKLKDEIYHVHIESDLSPGYLTYGELIIPGKTNKEIFLSTYICHPSMANNELSGPVVTTYLAKWIASKPRKYTYRIVFIPETIGSLTYCNINLENMKKNIIAGFNITCIGDDNNYSYVASRYGDTLADKVATNILRSKYKKHKIYSYLSRGSDERQYCSPGIDLPLITLCRSKYGEYPEYHTSLDNLEFVTQSGLYGGFNLVKDCITALEKNSKYIVTFYGEPQLGKRNLYPNVSTKKSGDIVRDMMNILAYTDGTNDLIDISNITGIPVEKVSNTVELLFTEGLIREISN